MLIGERNEPNKTKNFKILNTEIDLSSNYCLKNRWHGGGDLVTHYGLSQLLSK